MDKELIDSIQKCMDSFNEILDYKSMIEDGVDMSTILELIFLSAELGKTQADYCLKYIKLGYK
jgi:hypothetical protein